LASAFVPTLTGFLTSGDRRGGWLLSSALINLVFVSLSLLSLVSVLFAPQIVQNLLAPQYPPELQALTTSILRILLIAPAIFGVSGLLMGILNAHQVFLWSALAPSMLWSGMIIGVLVLSPTMGIFGLAWGYVLGAVLHLLIQVPAIFRLPARKYFVTFGLRLKAVREVGRLMGPRVLGVAAVQINFVVNTILATGMAVGSLTSLKYAWAIMTMPQVVIAQSIAIAALPTFSAQAAAGRLSEMRSSLAVTLRGVIFLSLPATMGLILLRQPIITMFFQRGAFTANSTILVSWALIWYTTGLIGHGGVEILSRAFYALHDTKTPVIIGIAAMSLNVIFSLLFPYLFESVGWLPFGGLALANSLATGLEMSVLWVLMRRRLDGLEGKIVLDGFIKSGLATLLMSLVLWGWLVLTQNQPAWLIVLGGILLGGGTYLTSSVALGTQETKIVTTYLQRKFVN
jgi:putative peptidoglycan lipid II flippase